MRIAFVDTSNQVFTPDTPYDQPLGGTQSAAAYLSAALAARGHEVALLGAEGAGQTVRGVACLARQAQGVAWMRQADVVISLTRVIGKTLRKAGVTAPIVLWQHADVGVINAPYTNLDDPEERAELASAVYVSDYQRGRFLERYGVDGPVIRNAICPLSEARPLGPSFLARGEAPRSIYASFPSRGLDILLLLMPTLRRRLPGATLDVYSDSGIYQGDTQSDPYAAFLNLAADLPGVTPHGSVSQGRLAEAFGAVDLFVYPTIFAETSCIVLMEALAAGAIVAASDTGALKETAAGWGEFFERPEALTAFVANAGDAVMRQVEAARADPAAFEARRDAQARHFRETHTWARRAAEWEVWLGSL